MRVPDDRVQVEAALRTALQLRKYDDILDPGLVYAFLALVGFYSSFYGTCSKVRGLPQEVRVLPFNCHQGTALLGPDSRGTLEHVLLA